MNKEPQSTGKDIIYIDVEDDVTSVIGKVRASSEKIIALVPPKNIGSLQSAVNLRLLQKAADNAGKRIVLITNNSGLTALAAGVKIPVAKNLQSKPEIPTAASVPVDTDDDVINGDELPVGELAAATNQAVGVETAASIAAAPVKPNVSDDDFTITGMSETSDVAPAAATALAIKKPHGSVSKVPNFNRFRKWIFIGGGLIVAIVALIILTNLFWTSANIVITAQTSNEPIDQALTLTATGATNPDQGQIKVVTKQIKKTASVDFTATGSKTTGTKATGTLTLSNTMSTDSMTIPAGSVFQGSTSGLNFTTDKDVTVGGVSVKGGKIVPSSATVSMTASDIGANYNTSTQAYSSSTYVVAASGSDTTGGTSQTFTVVSANDIATATAKLPTSNATDAKAQLTSEFGSDSVVISDSFTASDGTATSAPAQDAQATTAKLSRDSTYTLTAIPKSEIKITNTAYLNSLQTAANQKIYDDGSSIARVAQFVTSPSGVQTLHVVATGKIGPKIDEVALKNQLVGKKTGEITSLIMGTKGVRNVTVNLSPFWRTTAPSADKITISFNLSNGN